MVFGDGRTEKYEMYCSVALRLQYCPEPFGCGDVPSPFWHTGIQRLVDSTWVEAYSAPHELADSLRNLVEQVKDPGPEVEMLVTLHVRDRITERITVDSVGARYAELADTPAARGLSESVLLGDGAHRFKLIAFNYFLEK